MVSKGHNKRKQLLCEPTWPVFLSILTINDNQIVYLLTQPQYEGVETFPYCVISSNNLTSVMSCYVILLHNHHIADQHDKETLYTHWIYHRRTFSLSNTLKQRIFLHNLTHSHKFIVKTIIINNNKIVLIVTL